MKLGIAVVYMVKPENTELLDLHLDKIRTMTAVPYTIYAGVRHLPAPLLRRLEAEPGLELITLPEHGPMTGGAEHSFYLEHLIERAATGDVTHVVTMHVDSFPIRPDWAETIAGQLSGDTVLATLSNDGFLSGYSTACLFFRRDFWGECRPRLRLTGADRSSPEYERFCREYQHNPEDSGVGYIFRAYSRGKAFLALERSNAGRDAGGFGTVHGDLVFHLGGAHRLDKLSEEEQTAASKTLFKALIAMRSRMKKWVPGAIKRRAKRQLHPLFVSLDHRSCDQVRRELLNDPEKYLEKARSGPGSE
jgi:hypothetical protein